MGKKKLNSDVVEKIKLLRTQGYSLPEISVQVKVPRTTVFRYIKNVKILSEFLKEWSVKRGGSRKRKLLKENQAFDEAKNLVGKLSEKDKLLFLSALYWGEGSKKDFGLSNTDPRLIKFFVNGLRQVFGIDDHRLRISLRLYEDLDKEKCLNFWSEVVNIPRENFVSINILNGKKRGKLEYGMCRVRVLKGADLLKKVFAVNKIVAEQIVPIA